jgi:hypothetical protein
MKLAPPLPQCKGRNTLRIFENKVLDLRETERQIKQEGDGEII